MGQLLSAYVRTLACLQDRNHTSFLPVGLTQPLLVCVAHCVVAWAVAAAAADATAGAEGRGGEGGCVRGRGGCAGVEDAAAAALELLLAGSHPLASPPQVGGDPVGPRPQVGGDPVGPRPQVGGDPVGPRPQVGGDPRPQFFGPSVESSS